MQNEPDLSADLNNLAEWVARALPNCPCPICCDKRVIEAWQIRAAAALKSRAQEEGQ